MAAAGGAAYHNYAHILAAIQDKKLNCQLEDVSRQFGMISLQVIALRLDQIMSIVRHTLLLNLLTYMRVFDFGQKTPRSQDGCIDHCNVGFT